MKLGHFHVCSKDSNWKITSINEKSRNGGNISELVINVSKYVWKMNFKCLYNGESALQIILFITFFMSLCSANYESIQCSFYFHRKTKMQSWKQDPSCSKTSFRYFYLVGFWGLYRVILLCTNPWRGKDISAYCWLHWYHSKKGK